MSFSLVLNIVAPSGDFDPLFGNDETVETSQKKKKDFLSFSLWRLLNLTSIKLHLSLLGKS